MTEGADGRAEPGGTVLIARPGWRVPLAFALLAAPLCLFAAIFTVAAPYMGFGKEARQVAWLIWVTSPLAFIIAAVAIRRLLVRPELLRVGKAGLVWTAFSPALIPWDDVREVRAVKLRARRMICVDLIDSSKYQRAAGAYDQADNADRYAGLGDFAISAAGTDRSTRQILSAIRRHGGQRLFGR